MHGADADAWLSSLLDEAEDEAPLSWKTWQSVLLRSGSGRDDQ